jgi:hypothetical protein
VVGRERVLTGILQDDSGIMEIDHPGKGLKGWKTTVSGGIEAIAPLSDDWHDIYIYLRPPTIAAHVDVD